VGDAAGALGVAAGAVGVVLGVLAGAGDCAGAGEESDVCAAGGGVAEGDAAGLFDASGGVCARVVPKAARLAPNKMRETSGLCAMTSFSVIRTDRFPDNRFADITGMHWPAHAQDARLPHCVLKLTNTMEDRRGRRILTCRHR